MKNILIILTVILACNQAIAQQFRIEVIPLNNRTPDQVVDVIRPLLPPGGSVSGMNNQLIVKTTPANLEEIKSVLASIDSAQRRLLISVTQDMNVVANDLEHSLSGRISSGDVSISSRSSPDRDRGFSVNGSDSEGNTITYRGLDTTRRSSSNNVYTVQALDGEPAYIQSGLSVPVSNQTTRITRNGVVVQDTVSFRDATSGFYVLPRINGDQVTLMVAPQSSSVNPGRFPTFNVQNVQTTVRGRLGEWLQIGGINQSSESSGSGILHGSSNQGQDNRSILIKVEEIR